MITRLLTILLCAGMLFGAATAIAPAAPALAAADDHAGHDHATGDHAGHGHDAQGAETAKATSTRRLGNSKATGLFFWLFAILCVAGSLFVITRRNMVTAVMGMVGTFFAVAAIYAMLFAHFLAVIQVLVYAGAIMVLFVFVIMILNRPEDEPWSTDGLISKGVVGLAIGYLMFRLVQVLWAVTPSAATANLAPGKTIDGFDFGSAKAVGSVLFSDYLFPFEAVSIVLLIAVVGAVAISRPISADDSPSVGA